MSKLSAQRLAEKSVFPVMVLEASTVGILKVTKLALCGLGWVENRISFGGIKSVVAPPACSRFSGIWDSKGPCAFMNMTIKKLPLKSFAGLLAVALLLSACASHPHSNSTTLRSRERVYNPQTHNYEWEKKRGDAPTSPGADTAPIYR